MKKLAVAALVLSSLSGGAYAHEAGEFFIRAGSATVRPTEGSITCWVWAVLTSVITPS
jgi:outer membrane protein